MRFLLYFLTGYRVWKKLTPTWDFFANNFISDFCILTHGRFNLRLLIGPLTWSLILDLGFCPPTYGYADLWSMTQLLPSFLIWGNQLVTSDSISYSSLDLWPSISDLRSLTFDFWPLTYARIDLRSLTWHLTWILTVHPWLKASDLRLFTGPLTQLLIWHLTRLLTSGFWSSIFDQRSRRALTPSSIFNLWPLISEFQPTLVF